MRKTMYIIVSILFLSGCTKGIVPVSADDGIIDIWYYVEKGDESGVGPAAVNTMQRYANANDVNVEITKVDGEEMDS